MFPGWGLVSIWRFGFLEHASLNLSDGVFQLVAACMLLKSLIDKFVTRTSSNITQLFKAFLTNERVYNNSNERTSDFN